MTRTWFTRRNVRLHLEHLEDRSVPSTFTVNTTLDDVTPANGKFSLREAITKANNNPGADTIVLPAGVFKIAIAGANEDGNLSGDLDIRDGVTIQGAGAGLTVIDGQQLDRVFDVLGTSPSSFKLVLQGLTIRNGLAALDGGGIRVNNPDLVVRDCVVTGNRAGTSGGGISNSINPGSGNVTLVRTTVVRNVATAGGGGLSVPGATTFTLKDSTVRRNLTSGSGGGIIANTATLTNSTVSGNTASLNGGGIVATTTSLTNSTVSGNSAGGGGGGIDTGTANLTNCTVSGNSAVTNGGGVFATTAFLLNVTVAENSAHTGGGLFHNPGGTFSVRNTMVALNLTDDFTGAGADVSGVFTSQGHNLIGDGTGGTGFSNGASGDLAGTSANPIDPKLGPLQNNGGKTQTMALKAGSLAIDHGDNGILPPTDQRGFGFARKKDGNGDGIAVVDIGAFER